MTDYTALHTYIIAAYEVAREINCAPEPLRSVAQLISFRSDPLDEIDPIRAAFDTARDWPGAARIAQSNADYPNCPSEDRRIYNLIVAYCEARCAQKVTR